MNLADEASLGGFSRYKDVVFALVDSRERSSASSDILRDALLVGLKMPEGTRSIDNTPMSAQHALSTSVRDSAVLLDIAAGALPGEALAEPARHGSFLDAVGRDPGRLRIGLTTMLPGGVHTDPQAVEAVLSAARTCADLGHDVIPVETPWDPAEVGASFSTLMAAELIATVEERLHELGRELREDDLEPFTAFMVEYYRSLPAAEANRALRDAQRIGWSVGQAFEGLDVMLTPVLARPALRLGEMDTTRPETMYELGPLMTAWTSAMSSRIRTFEPTSCQRRSGVAASRLRMSFSRSATSGMAAKMPTCMTDNASIDGTKYEMKLRFSVWIVSVSGTTSGGRPPRLTTPSTAPTDWNTAAVRFERDGSV